MEGFWQPAQLAASPLDRIDTCSVNHLLLRHNFLQTILHSGNRHREALEVLVSAPAHVACFSVDAKRDALKDFS